jgi:hypothetical protein
MLSLSRRPPSVVSAIVSLLVILFVIPTLGRCDEAVQSSSEAGIAYFEKEIRPLLIAHCYQCHCESTGEREGGLVLDNRDGWRVGGDSGPAVVPGDVEASHLIRAVRYDDDGLQMPPVKPLAAADVARLEHWVRIGAPAPEKIHLSASDNPADPVAGKDHWAFGPLSESRPPVVSDVDWPLGDIDRFVLSRLEQERLHRTSDAQRNILARRVYVQLTGVPPTPEQLNDFLDDTNPLAYERLVDSLLASPPFGERFGRHWLDLARYADSNGLDENFLFREAWRYRNWVIGAVSDDMPYDRFITLQIAGDLLAYETMAQRDYQRIASGFLVLGPKVLLGNDPENQKMEVADEQIDTIGRALLGQTLGCARCHDHKFDPVPTADYYALAGIFASTRVMEQRYMLGEQRVMEQLIGLGDDGVDLDEAYEKYWRERPKLGERKAKAEAALQALQQGDAAAFAEISEKHADSIAEDAKDPVQAAEQRSLAQQSLIDQLTRAWNEPPAIPPRAMAATDQETPADEPIRIAGQFDNRGEVVRRGVLQVLCDGDDSAAQAPDSGRIALAKWLTDGDQRSGQLVARVLANRIWHHLIGRGLVRTVDNFGRTGEPPSHPELLDHLAKELIAHDWSVKSLVRQIVLSHTFRLSSDHISANHDADPENQWLWRANRRRLDPESFRDAMLATADSLQWAPMDSTVAYLGDQATAVGSNSVRRRTDFPCRSVYLPVIRNDLPELFEIFDFADPHTTTGMRPNTTVPTQGLFMLNDEMVMDAAEATARRIMRDCPSGDLEAQITRMYGLILNVPPSEAEIQVISEALAKFRQRFESGEPSAAESSATGVSSADSPPDLGPAELRSLALACHALFASSRFQFLE